MSVKKTAQGTYRARVRTRDGRQIGRTFKLKGDAQAWEREQLKVRDEGGTVAASRLTVAEWADRWLASARNLAPSSVETYQKALAVILPSLGHLKLVDLTPDRIDAFLTADADDYAPSTVHRHYRTIHRLCSTAVRRGHLPSNPADAVDPPKVPHKETKFLTAAEVEQLAAAIQPRFRAFILLAGYGGLRWGELQALRPEHVNGCELTIIEQIGGTDVKTEGSRRRVVLPESVGEELAAHLEAYPGDYVFTRPDGRPLSHSAFNNNRFKPALKAAGLDSTITIHTLRHTAISLWIKADVHPKLVSEMAGHSSIAITMDRYGHLFASMHEEAAAKVDDLRKTEGKHLRVV